jgi:hypothetical protein
MNMKPSSTARVRSGMQTRASAPSSGFAGSRTGPSASSIPNENAHSRASADTRRDRIDRIRASSGSSSCGLCTSQRICRSSIATSRPMSAASESTMICSGACVLTPSDHAVYGPVGSAW